MWAPGAVAASLAVLAVALSVSGGGTSPAGAAASLRTVDVGGAPMRVAVTGAHVAVIDRRSLRLRLFRAGTMRPAGAGYRLPLPAGAAAVDVSTAGDVVWVAAADALDSRGWLVRVDLAARRTGVRPLPFPPVEVRARGPRSAAVLTQGGSLYEASLRRLAPRGEAAGPADAISAGGTTGWMLTSGDERGVQRLRRVAGGRPVAGLPAVDGRQLEVGAGWLWVTAACGKRVGRVRPAGGGVRCLAVTASRLVVAPADVWAAGGHGDLIRVDPESGRVTRRLDVGAGVSDLAAGAGHLWVVGESGVLARLPLTRDASRPAPRTTRTPPRPAPS